MARIFNEPIFGSFALLRDIGAQTYPVIAEIN